jgi:hypothetical protein
MSMLISGLLGLAVNIVPSLFKIFARDREEGDVREAAVEIVTKITGTDNPTTAENTIKNNPEIQKELKAALDELKTNAQKEQERAEEEQNRIDLLFLELESEERSQIQKQTLDHMNAELESVDAARSFALEMSNSKKPIVSTINPILSLLVTFGFLATLYLIMKTEEIANSEIFYTAIGTLATAFVTIVGFHFGSSSGSKGKDEVILAAPSQAEAQPAVQNLSLADTHHSTLLSTDGSVIREKLPLPDPGGAFGLFRRKAPGIMQDLMNDFGLTLDQAAGVLGNLGHECAGFRKLQEVSPAISGSRGGWGWPQWTGPRRRAFEAWCKTDGIVDLSSDEANYGYLKQELETTESRALRHLKKTQSMADATRSFMEKFERPGIKHLESRMNWAAEARKASRRKAA